MPKREIKPTSERYVQRQVILYLRKFGWHAINTSGAWRAARGMAGFPDIIAFKTGSTILIECKSATGELRPAQEKFKKRLMPCLGYYLSYYIAKAGEFEDFIVWLRAVYDMNKRLWVEEMDTWRPKHDHLV